MLKPISFITILVSVNTFATTFDKTHELNGVGLRSAKEESLRSYFGSLEKVLPSPLADVRRGVTNFTERCNNRYKGMRKFTDQNTDCKYFSEDTVETFVVRDIRKMDYFKELSEAYLVGKRVYNRGAGGHYELVTIREGQNEQKQKTVTIVLRMLDDKEVQVYTSPKFSKESSFNSSSSTFTLTEISEKETKVKYEYQASTDHWLLNKELTVPQIFAWISKSINHLNKTVEEESLHGKRDLASRE